MQNLRIIKIKLAMLCLILASLAGLTACNDNRLDEVEIAALKAADYADLNNLMSLHSWYHAAFKNAEEIEKIWSKRDDIIWAQNWGYWKGRDSIMQYYGREAPKADKLGGFVWHTITTGAVEIAGDRKTAKGIWYTPGVVGQYGSAGKKSMGLWMWEKYGVEFIREDGEWKIWHMKVYTDFAVAVGDGIGDKPAMMGPPPTEAKENSGEMVGSETASTGKTSADQPDYVYQDQYKGWAPDAEPQLIPRPPEPYDTWENTWSYINEGE